MRRRNFIHFFQAKNQGSPEASGNPLFPVKPKPWKLYPIIVTSLVLAVLVTVLTAMIYGPYLTLRTVEVSGAITLDPQAISDKLKEQFHDHVWLILPNSHRWFFNAKSSEIVLQENFPLKSVHIQKIGSVIKVNVVEDISMVALHSGDQIYLLNPAGKVIRLADDGEKTAVLAKIETGTAPAPTEGGRAVIHNDMPVIREKTVGVHALDDQLYNASVIESIIQFSSGLKQMGIEPFEFVSEDISLPWFSVTSNKDFLVLFDAEQDIDTQLTVLKTVVNEYFATQESPPYIDVRFGNRVYTR